MSRKLQIKRGPKERLPVLAEGEFGMTTDEVGLYLGTGTENVRLAAAGADGKIPTDQLPDGMVFTTVSFTAEQWSDGVLNIQQAAHGRKSARFGFMVRHLVGETYRVNTWAARCTEAEYLESGEIQLKSADHFAGEIMFYG